MAIGQQVWIHIDQEQIILATLVNPKSAVNIEEHFNLIKKQA